MSNYCFSAAQKHVKIALKTYRSDETFGEEYPALNEVVSRVEKNEILYRARNTLGHMYINNPQRLTTPLNKNLFSVRCTYQARLCFEIRLIVFSGLFLLPFCQQFIFGEIRQLHTKRVCVCVCVCVCLSNIDDPKSSDQAG